MDRGDISLSRRRLSTTLRHYGRHRWKDVVGPVPLSVRWSAVVRRLDTTGARPVSRAADPPDDTREAWVAVRWRTAAELRERYAAEARLARALLSGVAFCLLAFLHRAWLLDGAGAGASLGMGFLLARFALPPAFRCWRIRTQALGELRDFLGRPAVWWPPSLNP